MEQEIRVNWQKSSPLAQKKLGEITYYPKVDSSVKNDLQQLAYEISCRTTFKRGDVVGVLTALTDLVAERLSGGNVVHLDGLGTLKVRLTTDERITKLHHRSPEHVMVKGVQFIPETQLVDQFKRVRFTQQAPKIYTDEYDDAALKRALAVLMNENEVVKRSLLEAKTGVSSSKAKRFLANMVTDGVLKRIGKTHPVYVPGENWE